jgi:putative GTP pyrophosphokinase
MTEEELRIAFETRKPSLRAFGLLAMARIVALLESQFSLRLEKLFQIPPKPRVKETDSFLEKALVRKPKANPLLETTDQVGIRFVVLLLEDIDLVGKAVQQAGWRWQKDRDHEEERLAKPDYFAYQSDHYVIHVDTATEHEGVKIPAGISCEIQIRTILQHAYAEMAHSCDYKPSIRLPEDGQRRVKRSLAKGSALIETTDDVFREIKEQLAEYSRSVDALLHRSCEIYLELTNEKCNPNSILGMLIADTYKSQLTGLTPDRLQVWAVERSWLREKLLAKRSESVFYRDSVVMCAEHV